MQKYCRSDHDLRIYARKIAKQMSGEGSQKPVDISGDLPEGVQMVPPMMTPDQRAMYNPAKKEATKADIDALFADADEAIARKFGGSSTLAGTD